MKCLAVVVLLGLLAFVATAQTSAPAWSPAKSIGMFAYPKNQQNPDQQLKDESECYGSAKQNSGIDPQATAPAAPSAQEQQAAQRQAAQQAGKDVPKGGTVKGSAKGAAGPSPRPMLSNRPSSIHFKKAFAACMDARGYSVQ